MNVVGHWAFFIKSVFTKKYSPGNCYDTPHQGESFADFATRKQQEASECNIGDLKSDEILAFVIVSQCNNIKIKEKFLENKTTKLCDIISLGRAIESAQKSAKIGQEASEIGRAHV